MANILIIGAGWLGQPLAQMLHHQGHTVVATQRHQPQQEKHLGVTLAPLDLAATDAKDQLAKLLKNHQIAYLIGTFPPGFRHHQGEDYPKQWQLIADLSADYQLQKLLMISSTSVYPNHAKTMREEDATLPLALQQAHDFSTSAHLLLQAEQAVINSRQPYAIIRCSGLIGPNRPPARFVAQLTSVSTHAPANMLHQQDAIGIINFMLTHEHCGVVNASTPQSVSKAEFYQAALKHSGSNLALPPFTHTPDKQINSEKIQALGYRFHFQSILEAIDTDSPI